MKIGNESDYFFSVSFAEQNSPVTVENTSPVDIDYHLDFEPFKTENSIFQIKSSISESPKAKLSNCSTFRFGSGPLESIEESQVEHFPLKNDTGSTLSYKSQQASPRFVAPPEPRPIKSFNQAARSTSKRNAHSDRKQSKRIINSPYAQILHFSPSRLPTINTAEKTKKFLRHHNAKKNSPISLKTRYS